MGVLLGPWPFLVGGATAVEVTLRLDGDVVEQRYLWRGGDDRAFRDGDGLVRVRSCEDGFELLVHGVCDGVVRVGERQVSLRELTLCGVAAVPLGPSTTARLRLGATELHVAATTAPRKLALAPRRSARELATLAVGAAAALVCAFGVVVTMNAPPRKLDWQLRYDDWLARLTHGHAEGALVKFYAVTAPPTRAKDAPAARPNDVAPAKPATPAAKAAANSAAAHDAEGAATRRRDADFAPETAAKSALTLARADAPSASAAARASAGAARSNAAGVVGALARWRAEFLGDERVSDAVELALSDRRAFDADATGANSGGASGGSASGDSANSGSASGTASATNSSDDAGGLGLSGVGAGGGGDDTIAIGNLGTIGHGSGSGSGFGYGRAAGRLHRSSDDSEFGEGAGFQGGFTIACPAADAVVVPSSCDAELIRRVVRAHVNEVRFCYERALQSRPELTGRVVTQFHIAADGSAADAAVASSTLADARVGACVAGAVRRWEFPRCAAQVSYPFVFVPSGD